MPLLQIVRDGGEQTYSPKQRKVPYKAKSSQKHDSNSGCNAMTR
jgi:hypothetical protein